MIDEANTTNSIAKHIFVLCFLSIRRTAAGSNFFWSASHAVGGAAFATRAQTPSFLKSTGESEPIIPQQQQQQRQQQSAPLRSKSPSVPKQQQHPPQQLQHHHQQQPHPLPPPQPLLQSAYPPACPAPVVAPITAPCTADQGQTPSGARGPPCDDCGAGIV